MRWFIAAVVAAASVSVAQAELVKKVSEEVVVAAPVQALTLHDAKSALCNLPPGGHQVTFIHPYTCCPVTVCFCLPCGCYNVECGGGLCAEKLRFSYPGLFNDVVIKFNKNGSVSVND